MRRGEVDLGGLVQDDVGHERTRHGTEQQAVGAVAGRDQHVGDPRQTPEHRRVVDARRSETHTDLAERRARETGHHTKRLAHDLVHAARGDVGREAGVFDRRADRDAVIGPRNHVVAVDLLHDRPAPGVVIGHAEVRDLAPHRSDGKMHTELLTEPARPRAARDHHRARPDRVTVDDDRRGIARSHLVDRAGTRLHTVPVCSAS